MAINKIKKPSTPETCKRWDSILEILRASDRGYSSLELAKKTESNYDCTYRMLLGMEEIGLIYSTLEKVDWSTQRIKIYRIAEPDAPPKEKKIKHQKFLPYCKKDDPFNDPVLGESRIKAYWEFRKKGYDEARSRFEALKKYPNLRPLRAQRYP